MSNNKIINSEIHLVVRGIGTYNFLSNSYEYVPSEVLINGAPSSCKKRCKFDYQTNNVTLKFDIDIKTCENMFANLDKIIEINLSKFDASKVTNMKSMFYKCYNLEKIEFGKIDTSKVENMESLFEYCKKLSSIDLSNFDTSSVITMSSMFRHMEKIKYIDASSFKTPKLTNMYDMFGYCYELLYVNLSSFDTSKVVDMRGIFVDCWNLRFADLQNFDTSLVTTFEYSFSKCKSLIYLNFKSFKVKEMVALEQTFDNVPKSVNYCYDDNSVQNYLIKDNKIVSNCPDLCFQNDRKIDLVQNKCVNSCTNERYEYNNLCFDDCPPGTYKVFLNRNICLNDITHFYLDKTNHIYKECYKNCKSCNGQSDEANNNCNLCIDNYMFINDPFAIPFNCYLKCEFYYYFENVNNYKCTQNDSCPVNYKLIEDEKKCIKECKMDGIYIFEYNKKCFTKCPVGTKELFDLFLCYNENESGDMIFKNLGEYIRKGYMNLIFKNITKNKEDYIAAYGNITYQLTTSDNQKNKTRNNLSSIDLLNCENILRDIYDINDSLSLNILKVEYRNENLLIPIVGYEIYHPLNNSKLDLKYCNETIKLEIPVSINENELYKYETNSEFYTDNCFSYTSENGTDIILNDRKQEFVDNNLSLCENKCTYVKYDKNTKQSQCDCYIKNEIDLIYDIIENPNKLSNNFSSEESSSINSNILSLKCTKELFSKNGLKNNISSYILSIIFLLFLSSIVLFLKCGYPLLEEKIRNIIKIISKNSEINKQTKRAQKKSLPQTKRTRKNFRKNHPPIRNINFKIINNLNVNKKNHSSLKRINQTTSLGQNKKGNQDLEKKKKGFNLKLRNNIFELNSLDYKCAILYDKRTCCNYYISLLKIKHPILFSLIPISDYNSHIIKLCITSLSFSIYYAINFSFFDDKTIHKIYTDKGNYNFIYFIPKISISFVCSYFISLIIKYIFLSERNLLHIRKQKNIQSAELVASKEKKNLVIKYIIFFILGILFLAFFWMLLSSFGAVYQNTQLIVFENALICFGISFVYPFFINIFPCIFRISSLNDKTKKQECLYKFSKFLQIL